MPAMLIGKCALNVFIGKASNGHQLQLMSLENALPTALHFASRKGYLWLPHPTILSYRCPFTNDTFALLPFFHYEFHPLAQPVQDLPTNVHCNSCQKASICPLPILERDACQPGQTYSSTFLFLSASFIRSSRKTCRWASSPWALRLEFCLLPSIFDRLNSVCQRFMETSCAWYSRAGSLPTCFKLSPSSGSPNLPGTCMLLK